MSVDPVAIWCGSVSVTESELLDRVGHTLAERSFSAHILVPIVEEDRVAAVVAALVARAADAIPLLGDDRWGADYWAELRTLADGATEYPGIAWAAFSSGSSGSPRVIVRSEESWSGSFAAVT